MAKRELIINGMVVKKKKKKINWGAQIGVVLSILFILAPFWVVFVTSITSFEESNMADFVWWPHQGATLRAYGDVIFKEVGGINLLKSFWNTMWIYVPAVLVGVLISTMAAFAFAKMDFPGKEAIFSVLMITMMMPNIMGTHASFLMYDYIGWINTPWPLMLPRMFGGISVVFFLRQYVVGIPQDIINSAKLDGASNWRILTTIIVPAARPAMIAQFILGFLSGYNDYTHPLIYLQDARMYTLQIALNMFYDPYTQDWPVRMAGCLVTMVPLAVLYISAQKIILNGIAMTSGLKG